MPIYTASEETGVIADEGTIRRVRFEDLRDLSTLIKNTLLMSNSVDYDMHVIQNLSRQYSSKNLADMALRREMFVHILNGRITGSVSRKNDMIYAFFIAPDMQKKGIGSLLLLYVEDRARADGVTRIKVGASITAKRFYLKHGYHVVRQESDSSYGDVFYMEKRLGLL